MKEFIITFLLCTVCLEIGFRVGLAEGAKDAKAACVAPKVWRPLPLDMTKRQQKLWINYYRRGS